MALKVVKKPYYISHKVRRGESLSGILRRYGKLSERQLKRDRRSVYRVSQEVVRWNLEQGNAAVFFQHSRRVDADAIDLKAAADRIYWGHTLRIPVSRKEYLLHRLRLSLGGDDASPESEAPRTRFRRALAEGFEAYKEDPEYIQTAFEGLVKLGQQDAIQVAGELDALGVGDASSIPTPAPVQNQTLEWRAKQRCLARFLASPDG